MIIPFKKEHLECMIVREHEKQLLSYTEHLVGLESGIAFTGLIDGRIVACGGIQPFLNGNADIWLIPSIYIEQYKFATMRFVKKWIEQAQKDLALTRMQSSCINDDLHNRWMQFLGFEKEGVMRKYFNETDYAVYGRCVWE